MTKVNLRPLCAALMTMVAAGCSMPPRDMPLELPVALQPPAGEQLAQVLRARGVQIYECAPVAARPGYFGWTLKAPDAVLVDAAGRPMGRHYAGPTWEAPDGSKVTGRVKARNESPDREAIPWLLLDASTPADSRGDGLFSGTRSILRVQTLGGLAPREGCSSGTAGTRVSVPYRAVYHFYRAAAPQSSRSDSLPAPADADTVAVMAVDVGLFPNEMRAPALH